MKDEFGIALFEQIIDALWEKRAQVKEEDYYFDYPEYGGLPKKVAHRLMSDVVDAIQEVYDEEGMRQFRTKAQFRKFMKERFFPLAGSV